MSFSRSKLHRTMQKGKNRAFYPQSAQQTQLKAARDQSVKSKAMLSYQLLTFRLLSRRAVIKYIVFSSEE